MDSDIDELCSTQGKLCSTQENEISVPDDHICSLFDDDLEPTVPESSIEHIDSKKQRKIIIEKQEYDDVKTYDKVRYNTNNIWPNKIKPDDYDVVLSKGCTKWWIDKFSTNYVVINLPSARWMTNAFGIGAMTGIFSNLYEEDLEDYIKKYETSFIKDYLDKHDIFIRGETVSLKQGMHGVGPYKSLKQIVESLVTTTAGHSILDTRDPQQNTDKSIKLYLMNWVDIIEFQEFRVFVKDNKITAISQQSLYRKNTILNSMNEDDKRIIVEKWVKIITEYFDQVIVKKIDHVSSYCIDIAILKNDVPYFIEINSFGAEYASGSSLFEWVKDREILYGEKEELHFRYTG